jgi:hypothetical protein
VLRWGGTWQQDTLLLRASPLVFLKKCVLGLLPVMSGMPGFRLVWEVAGPLPRESDAHGACGAMTVPYSPFFLLQVGPLGMTLGGILGLWATIGSGGP